MERKDFEPTATVISLVPFVIDETKPGMTPTKFFLEAAPEDGYSTLLIKGCRHGVYLDEFRPTLIVPTAPHEVAEAICLDYKKGQLGIIMGEAEPGLFWVPGDYASEAARKECLSVFAAEFREAVHLQTEWFKGIVALADDAWSRFRQRGMISRMQKTAASRLKLDRDWLLDVEVNTALSECTACFEKVNPRAIVCRSCGAILNEEEYAKRSFAKKA